MTYKLQLAKTSADDPIYWQKFYSYVRDITHGGWAGPDRVNPYLKKYNASYYVWSTDPWDDYVIFDSESDFFMFMLEWS